MNSYPQELALQEKERGKKTGDSDLGQIHLMTKVLVMCSLSKESLINHIVGIFLH